MFRKIRGPSARLGMTQGKKASGRVSRGSLDPWMGWVGQRSKRSGILRCAQNDTKKREWKRLYLAAVELRADLFK